MPPSSTGSLDDRLQEAAINAQKNRGRHRSETLRPRRRSLSTPSTVRSSDRVPRPSVACGTAFDPTVQAILDYQSKQGYGKPIEKIILKDPKADQRRPGETVYTYCNTCSDDPSKPTWCTHPEQEGPAWDLLQDAKVNRGLIELDDKEYKIDLPKFEHKLETLYAMIHPANLCALLTENVDEAAAKWIVFTTNGTLLAYSDGTEIGQARTVAALVGRAWRLNDKLAQVGLTDIPDAGSFLSNVSIFAHDPAAPSSGLKSMFAEVNGLLIATHDVKERLLVAAMIPLEKVENAKADKAEEEDEGSKAEETEGAKEISPKEKLMMKVEGMVDVLLADLADFKMPDEFY